MKEQKINPQESLSIITDMIEETRQSVGKNSGIPLLIWGYLTVIVSIAVSVGLFFTGNSAYHLLWLAILLGYPLMAWLHRPEKGIKTAMTTTVNRIWALFGIVAFAVSIVSYFTELNEILFIISIFIALSCTTNGIVIRDRTMVLSGCISLVLSLGILPATGLYKIWIFAAVFVVLCIIPGHILQHKYRK